MKYKLIVCFSTLAMISTAYAEDTVSQSNSFEEFTNQYCARAIDDDDAEHIMILPASIFAENKTLTCNGVATDMRMTASADDPGHNLYNVDPLPGVATALDCDAKADEGMAIIALNCLPANRESKSHKKD